MTREFEPGDYVVKAKDARSNSGSAKETLLPK